MAIAVRSSTTATNAGGTSLVINKPTGTALNDVLLAVCWVDSDGSATIASIAAPAGFSQAGSNLTSTATSPCGKVFYKIATGSEPTTYTFTTLTAASTSLSLIAISGADTSTPIGVNPTLGTGSAATAQIAPSISGVAGDMLLCSYSCEKATAITYTAPSGMTETTDAASSYVASCVDYLVLTSTAATGTKTATASAVPDTAYRSFSMMINSGDASVPVTDAGSGTDAIQVDRSSTLTDTGTGADTPAVQVLTAITGTDTGTGVDTPVVAKFTVITQTDTGTGADSITVTKTDFLTLTETGTGTDTTAIFQASTLADTGTGADSIAVSVPNALTDSGVGAEVITIIDIPFTQILPASKPGVVYDLVAVRRIPQTTGEPSLILVDPIEWSALSYSDALNEAQELSISCLWASLSDTIVTRLRDLARQPTELWLYRNGRLAFSGPIQTGNVSGQSLNIEARGLLTYLKHMFVENDLSFTATDQFTIVKTLIDNWQNTDYGNYGIDTTHIGTSGVPRDMAYPKKELHNVAARIDDLAKNVNGFNYEIDPISRQMLLYYPLKGIDRSSGEDAVVFDSRNIASSNISFSVTPTDVASDGFGTATDPTGDGNLFSTFSNPELRAQYGRSGVVGNFDQTKEQSVLDAAVNDMVNARSEALMVPGPEARDTPDADLVAYGVGDIILYQPNEILTVSKPYRVRKRTVKVSANGQESVTLEFV